MAETDEFGATTTILDRRKYKLPVFDPDHRDAGDADLLRSELRAAESVILGSPMSHGFWAAPLKNALDCSGFDAFEITTVGLLGISGGRFPTSGRTPAVGLSCAQRLGHPAQSRRSERRQPVRGRGVRRRETGRPRRRPRPANDRVREHPSPTRRCSEARRTAAAGNGRSESVVLRGPERDV